MLNVKCTTSVKLNDVRIKAFDKDEKKENSLLRKIKKEEIKNK